MTLAGSEFVRRYLRHVLPSGLRSIRYCGFCHPAAKAKRQRIQIHTAMPFDLNSRPRAALPNLRHPNAVDRIDPVALTGPWSDNAALLPLSAAAIKRLAPFCDDIRVPKIPCTTRRHTPLSLRLVFARPTRWTAPFFPTFVAFQGKRNLPNAPMQPRIIRAAPKNRLRRAYTRPFV